MLRDIKKLTRNEHKNLKSEKKVIVFKSFRNLRIKLEGIQKQINSRDNDLREQKRELAFSYFIAVLFTIAER